MFKVLVHTITLIGISVTIWIIETKSVARQQEKKNHMKLLLVFLSQSGLLRQKALHANRKKKIT